ncbi:MAG: hypothetical protein SFY69_03875 [Planctomycetota bacterium]|nr:hypothetical protein [Planctomycetota bacterium]
MTRSDVRTRSGSERRGLVGAGAGLAALLGVLAACAGKADRPAAPSPRASDLAQAMRPPLRIDAIVGRTLVLPLGEADPGERLAVSIEGGGGLPARLVRLYGELPLMGPGSAAPDPWLGSPGEWQTIEADPREPAPRSGTWCAVIDIPSDPVGAVLMVNGEAVRCNYLPPPSAIQFAGMLAGADPWRPTRPPGMPMDLLTSPRFSPAMRSPLDRWRWRLLRDGLRPDAPEIEPFDDEVVERVARRQEDLWRVALARLYAADAGLTDRLKRRLAGAMEFGGAWAPVWETDATALEQLLSDLLDPSLPGERRVDLVTRFLDEREAGVAWVIDDGGTLDESRSMLLADIGVANLLDRATLSWVAPPGSPETPDLLPVPAGGVRRTVAPAGMGPAGSPNVRALSVHLGKWSREVAVLATPAPVSPPGLTASPFVADWSLDAWRSGTARPLADGWETAALLHRPSGPEDEAVPGAIRSRRWELYVECKLVPGIGDPSREQVTIYAGPLGRPTAIVQVGIGGTQEFLPVPGLPPEAAEIAPPPTTARVTRTQDRWTFRINLPPGSVERDGLLRLGIVRRDALSRRSAWPRPMLPWDVEPARLCVDTRAWDGLPASQSP